jgi:Ca-activated chloride channel family protein
MRFAEPRLLWLLLVVPVWATAAGAAAARRRSALCRFAGGRAYAGRFTDQVSAHRRAAKQLLVLVAFAAAVVALARPQWGTRLEPIQRRGVDVVIALDTSLSMAAEDVAPSRLEQARHEIGTLLDRLVGDRVGLVTFAGEATLTCPLTVDHDAVRLFLDAVDVEAVPVAGTSLAAALRVAIRAFGESPDRVDVGQRQRAIVLFSDGEDHAGGVEEAIGLARRHGVAVYAIGCGTERGGPIPLRTTAGDLTGYKKDLEAKVVTSRLEEAVLRRVALDSGGRYYRTTPAEEEIEVIASVLTAMDPQESGATLRRRYEERYQIPLAVALAALVCESVFGDRRRARPRRRAGEAGEKR